MPNPIGHSDHRRRSRLRTESRLRSVLREGLVEQDDIGSQLLDLTVLGSVSAIGGRDQQSEHEGGDGPDQAGPEPDDIFRCPAQMMFRQTVAE